jgi:DNA-binding PadR family transcriptional regulator
MSKSEAHPATGLAPHEREILTAWADTHKKSALMLFILLRLHGRPGWSQDLRRFIDSCTDEHLGVDNQSLHRALRRLEGLNLITHDSRSAPGTGARRKIYSLTQSGERVLAALLRGPLSYTTNPLFLDTTAAARST